MTRSVRNCLDALDQTTRWEQMRRLVASPGTTDRAGSQPTVGLVCEKNLVTEVLSAICRTQMELAWITHSYEPRTADIEPDRPRVILVQSDTGSPGFWAFVENLAIVAPRAALVVFGPATNRDAFRLGSVGVDYYAPTLDAVPLSDLGDAETRMKCLRRSASRSVGRVGVKEAQHLVRIEMFRTALETTHGNRHATARLLRVDRAYVLKMLRAHSELDVLEPPRSLLGNASAAKEVVAGKR